ncbi:MAG TPA: DUF1848 domain-containing protein [Clostridiales bacterium]|nr:DUF1848 domain-containing protein [Clostridiales bacterium]HOL90802.1 DUF1848 domain-containing protein [Clostridiales bacterium]HPP34613.1 DUF1848 domain-containing protein [Clostridiales bacterium]
MIISASRRTDIPAFYSGWLINRLRAGYVLTRNPMNHAQVSKVILSPDIVDCIVFWTKDPLNMLDKLDTIDSMGYKYYFQFTLTPYGRSVERRLRDKEEILKTFCELSDRIGKERVVWRYDPIILNEKFGFEYHKEQFARLCGRLAGHTDQCVISFVDKYPKLRTDAIREISMDEMAGLGSMISSVAGDFGITVKACCEGAFLRELGIEKAHCIDKALIERVCGYSIDIKKDRNQRDSCGCCESTDIGAYDTCRNGCIYCYANYSDVSVAGNIKRHDPCGELLVGRTGENDKITLREQKSNKDGQLKIL